MFDREKHIWGKLREHYDEALTLGHEVFCVVLQGSQNYNLDINNKLYQSDVDTKAIVLPSFNDFTRGKAPVSTTHIRKNNEHIDLKDIRIMFETFKKQNVNFVEVLFSEYFVVPSKYFAFWMMLRELGERLTHCNPSQTLKTMAGLSHEKHKALCHPYPTIKEKIDRYGYDGKQLHHIIRINDFMKKYINGIPFSQCLTERDKATLDRLNDAKLNNFSLKQALEIADELDKENGELKDKWIAEHGTKVDDTVYKEIDDIKVDVLKQWFKEQLKEN